MSQPFQQPYENISGDALMHAQDICKFYDATAVLNRVNMHINPGEIVTLLGPNGAGKTTLLRVLLRLEKPDSGTVTWAQHLRIGYVPQAFAITRAMPLLATDFLAFYGALTPEITNMCGISSWLRTPMQHLSGGALRRVLLARALLNSPNLLVLDEPTQGIDVVGQGDFYRMLETVRNTQKCGVLMVSHDVHVVMAASNRVVCLHHHVCCEGAPEHVESDPAFARMFGDERVAQLALYRHHHAHDHAVDGAVAHEHHAGCAHG
jgi:zinc transport system ATP-binding protein